MPDYTLIRSDRKTLSLEIDRAGNLIVRAPHRMPRTAIDRVVAARAMWIAGKRRQMAERAAAVSLAGENTVWYLGKAYSPVRCCAVQAGLQDDRFTVPAHWTTAQLRAWLKAECRRLTAARLAALSQKTGLQPTAVHMTEARTRWGSCSGKNSLNFTWRLIFCPPDVIDYVLIHELCHIRHKNHSAAFWALVAGYDPSFELKKAWLREHAALMDLF